METSSSPLMRVNYRLARAFGWTPDVIKTLTMAQARIYLELLDEEQANTNG